MFRSKQHKVLGGVCGGIAEQYGYDVAMVRLIAVLIALVFGVGIIPYIVLWIILPKK